MPSALRASLLATGNLVVEGSTMMNRRDRLRRAALVLALLVLAATVTGVAASAGPPGGLRTLPDGTKAWFPRGAEVAEARKIISYRTTYPFAAPSQNARHSRVYLWLVPLTGGGNCFVTNGAHGVGVPSGVCVNHRQVEKHPLANLASPSPGPNAAFVGGVGVGTRMDFFGLAKPAVARVELLYQNGERERLKPIDGFVLHELKPAHWKPGTRLVAAVAHTRSGKAISTEQFQTQAPNVYPCKTPTPIPGSDGGGSCP
jgi:hypothetical protein